MSKGLRNALRMHNSYTMYSREMTKFHRRYFACSEFDAWVGFIEQGKFQESELAQRLREHMKALKMKVWAEIYKFPKVNDAKTQAPTTWLLQQRYLCLPW